MSAETVDAPIPAACIAPSGSMNTNWSRRNFLLSPSLISLCPVTEVCGSSALGLYHVVLVGI